MRALQKKPYQTAAELQASVVEVRVELLKQHADPHSITYFRKLKGDVLLRPNKKDVEAVLQAYLEEDWVTKRIRHTHAGNVIQLGGDAEYAIGEGYRNWVRQVYNADLIS